MLVSDFNYQLPAELIAQFPPAERRGSRLLALQDGIRDLVFEQFASLLRPEDLLVFNDTRVIKARLGARKETGGKVEVLIERIQAPQAALAHIKASKSPKAGSSLQLNEGAVATVTGRDGDLYSLQFSTEILPFLDRHGEVPLPPYLGRAANEDDAWRYQTVYAKDPGAVAAPTAGLHFDTAMLEETLRCGVRHAWVTLHVGAGTFQSLRAEQVDDNRLHSERVLVDESCCAAVLKARAVGGRVIAIGTTSVRALECASADGVLAPYNGDTDIFIRPGYKFHSVDAMLTNFHLPESSLLMLVAAFCGTPRILDAYRFAVDEKYRFFSYGDAMFLTPESHA
jgi:S-adenosylmethionine:tRNA ribosyltransferase-isomerase